MKNFKNLALPVLAFLVMGLTSCSSDEDITRYSANTLENTELMNILKSKGYRFDKDGKLELNDLANNTTSLDLSGTNLKDLSGLDILPNLKEVNLSNNGYKMEFNFSQLPAQITGVDLTGNEVYEFKGLTKEDADGNITILHNLKKLYLPNSAKYNEDEIVSFYRTAKEVDMQMCDEKGTLQKYNTIRTIPNAELRESLKSMYSNLFVKDEAGNDVIDISKRLVSPEQKVQSLLIFPFPDDLDGIQYILHNKGYEGTAVSFSPSEKGNYTTMPYLRIPKSVQMFVSDRINTPNGIIFDDAVNLRVLGIYENSDIKEIDFSTSKAFGQRGIVKDMLGFEFSWLGVECCDKLEKITMPEKAKYANQIGLLSLKSLNEINLSGIEGVCNLSLIYLPKCKIAYPNLKTFLNGEDVDMEKGKTVFSTTKDVYDNTNGAAFVEKYRKNLRNGYGIRYNNDFNTEFIPIFDWTK
ncbi:MAG: hypothetical protein PUH24_00535 [Prevotellaceae bacterium]|nr:leucine-rich repeat domain-containing protein [Prevotella sp.]MDD7256770.1 hypothetical protein [Prevotellaceae bacterium]MDY6130807.1 hypothetical protein [Prevotella sp.]